jgi:hypothetical protein
MRTDEAHPDDRAALRAAFPEDECDPGLGWEAVTAYEGKHGIVLPEPYRTFVAEICDGSRQGPPHYGLIPLAALPDDWGNSQPARDPAAPFPLTAEWQWDNEDRPEEEWEGLLGPVFDHGSIVLGTDGCGMYWHLVVTGEHRGQVWLITGEGATPFGASFGFTTAEPGFAGWVRHWADGKEWFDV